MARRSVDPGFDDDAIANQDPLGEQGFEEAGFEDAPGGGPSFDAAGLVDTGADKPAGGGGQKVAGIPEASQHIANTPSEQRPDSGQLIIKERGGESKGDPAVGGTRDD